MLLAEEMMGLTLEELINDYGADLQAREHWFGVTWSINICGTELYEAPSDLSYQEYILYV